MLQLSEEQKTYIQSLAKHPGFAVLKEIKDEMLKDLAILLLENTDIEDSKQRKILKSNQAYAKAMNDIVSAIETNSLDIITPQI